METILNNKFEEENKMGEHVLKIYTASTRTFGGPCMINTMPYAKDEDHDAYRTAFAASWEMVRGLNNSTMSAADYKKSYYTLMQKSWKVNNSAWKAILKEDQIVICGFSKPNELCHRYLLVDILKQCGKVAGIKVEYVGEII